jgi:dihydroorotase
MSKLLALGMDLADVIAATTARPARLIGEGGRLGTLAPGAVADVSIFELETGRFSFVDTVGAERFGSQRLSNVATLIAGREVERLPAAPAAPWVDLVSPVTRVTS